MHKMQNFESNLNNFQPKAAVSPIRGTETFLLFHLFFPFMVTSGMIISSIEMPPCWNVSR